MIPLYLNTIMLQKVYTSMFKEKTDLVFFFLCFFIYFCKSYICLD